MKLTKDLKRNKRNWVNGVCGECGDKIELNRLTEAKVKGVWIKVCRNCFIKLLH